MMLKVTYVLLVGIIAVIMYEIIGRSFFHSPTSWYLEVASLLGACVATLAAAYVLQEEAHLGVDFVIDRMPPKWRNGMLCIQSIFGFMITGIIVTMMVKEIAWSINLNRLTDNAMIPVCSFQIVSTLGLLLLAVQFVIRMKKYYVKWTK
ncbi:MAG: TRAP transporter small permease subunit [Desulfarculaceae bacterium]|nr:TRAP transporter small permease subunit [Desulfarculaceae bacterium]MCF8118394.1 TRAP transporter small permease subunit [Desulfarculaceae bacterium]